MAKKKCNSQHKLALFGVIVVLGIGLMCKLLPNTTSTVIDSSVRKAGEVKEKIMEASESYDEACARIAKEKLAKL